MSSTSGSVAGANIILQRSTDGVTFSNVATTSTHAYGEYTFTRSEAVARTYYYRTIYTGSGTLTKATSNVAKVMVEPSPTETTLTASTITLAINQQVTFTATLYRVTYPWGRVAGVLAGKPVTIWHIFNGVRYNDVTKKTDAYGKITFVQKSGSIGVRHYYATFAGDASYRGSASAVVIYVGLRITLTVSTQYPIVSQPVTFIATLKDGPKPLSGKRITIYHFGLNNVRYTDTTKTTNANGQITLIQTFYSAGSRGYYATFAGDASYPKATSSLLGIRVLW